MNNPENIRSAAKFASSSLVHHAEEIIQQRAPELLGRDEVEAILDAAEEQYPVVTGEVKSLFSLGIIREILQGLVSEQVSIRHIAVILETLADWGSFGPVPSDLIIERIRQSLRRQICMEYADDRLTLRVLTLDPKLEKKFVDNSGSSGGNDFDIADNDYSADAEQHSADIAAAGCADLISCAVKRMEEKGFPPVILCSPRARSPVKEATRRQLPDLAVLSYLEIPSDISVEPVGEIRCDGNGE
jgi:flagellar biosynthesis protein FlhA